MVMEPGTRTLMWSLIQMKRNQNQSSETQNQIVMNESQYQTSHQYQSNANTSEPIECHGSNIIRINNNILFKVNINSFKIINYDNQKSKYLLVLSNIPSDKQSFTHVTMTTCGDPSSSSISGRGVVMSLGHNM